MTDNSLNIDNVLNIIFKTTTKSPQIFADFYLRKDISIISRWRNGTIMPKTDDFKKIVEFVLNESTEVQRLVIKDELLSILKNSSIKQELKKLIIKKEAFDDFLIEFLSVLTIDFDLNEEQEYSQPAAKKYFTPKKHSTDTEAKSKELDQMEDKNNISGNYKGVVKFDLTIDKKGNISSDNPINELTKKANLNIKDINKIKNTKYLLNKVTLVIVLFLLTSFLISQALGNKQSNTGLESTPSQNSQVLAAPKQYNTANTDKNKVSGMEKPAASSPTVSCDTNSTLKKSSVVEQKQDDSHAKIPPKASNKSNTENDSKSDSNTDSKNNNENSNNDIENSNNNININGSNNNIAIGSSTIILESE